AVEAKLGIKRGTIATAKLMQSYGALRMALVAAGIPFEQIAPSSWQKLMSCRTGGNKNVSKARAQQLFPQAHVTHAVADALLIATAARIVYAQRRGEQAPSVPPPPQVAAAEPAREKPLSDELPF